jgi:N-acetylglucosamine-6-phosphate deacetylase
MQSGGLVDLQANGYAGVDFNDSGLTVAAMEHALAAMLRAGVCHVLPTLITADAATLGARLAALDAAVAGSRLGRLMVPGFHVEGPFLNPLPGFAGCHPAADMVAPDAVVLARLQGVARLPILLLTLAPELPGALAVIRAATAGGIAVAIGHTAADRATIAAAVAAGAVLSTHLGNALPGPLQKFDNPLMAQLAEDRLMASVIADGLHVPPHALLVMARAKGTNRLVLVTDATAAAAAAPGVYRLGGMAIERLADGSVRLAGGERLAGSALTLDAAVRNLVAWDIAPAEVALRCARDNPLAVLAAPLARAGGSLPPSTVQWSRQLTPVTVKMDGIAWAA